MVAGTSARAAALALLAACAAVLPRAGSVPMLPVEVPLQHPPLRLPPGAPGPPLVAVLHPGTFKTGSSTLQSALIAKRHAMDTAGMVHRGNHSRAATDGLSAILAGANATADDGPAVVLPRFRGFWRGALNHANLATYLQYKEPEQTWLELTDFLSSAARNRSHVLLSSEFLVQPGTPNAPLIRALQPTWRVHVVLVYRRFFEWLVSVHYQKFHFREKLSERAADFLTLVEFLAPAHVRKESEGVWTGAAYDRYRRFPEVSVSVLDMHETTDAPGRGRHNGSLVRAFVCDHLPGPCAARACDWLANSESGRKVANIRANAGKAGEHIHYVELAFGAARHNGTVRHDIGERRSTSLVFHLKRTLVNATLPITCINETSRDFLWELSRAEEARLLPARHDEAALRARFEAYAARGKLCSVDVEAALRNETVRAVFRDLIQHQPRSRNATEVRAAREAAARARAAAWRNRTAQQPGGGAPGAHRRRSRPRAAVASRTSRAAIDAARVRARAALHKRYTEFVDEGAVPAGGFENRSEPRPYAYEPEALQAQYSSALPDFALPDSALPDSALPGSGGRGGAAGAGEGEGEGGGLTPGMGGGAGLVPPAVLPPAADAVLAAPLGDGGAGR